MEKISGSITVGLLTYHDHLRTVEKVSKIWWVSQTQAIDKVENFFCYSVTQ
jgi:hypothetical protein